MITGIIIALWGSWKRYDSGAVSFIDDEAGADPASKLATAFLLSFSGHTRRAYTNDLRHFFAWCVDARVHP